MSVAPQFSRTVSATASYLECAALAGDVYLHGTRTVANATRWARVAEGAGASGFAAATYESNGQAIVAFRGTDQLSDWASNLLMTPQAAPSKLLRALFEAVETSGVRSTSAASVGLPLALAAVFATPGVQRSIDRNLTRVPGEQFARALDYVHKCSIRPTLVTGHSLGGALAQLASMHMSLPCVAFNSPHLGDLRESQIRGGQVLPGAIPATSGVITLINSDRDPLSLLTRHVSLSHGREIVVRLPPFPKAPPTRSSVFRPTGGRLLTLPIALGKAAWDEVDLNWRTLTYLCEVLLHGHSMAPLLAAMRGDAQFEQSVPQTVVPYR